MNSTDTRERKTFRFWLHPQNDKALIREISTLKRDKQFTKSIRDGVRLFFDLAYNHSVELLLLLFPWVYDKIVALAVQRGEVKPVGEANEQLASMQQQLDYMTSLLLKQGAVPIAQGEKLYKEQPVSEAAIADKLEVTKAATSDRWGNFKTLYNMQLSLYGAEPRRWDNLPTDAIEYGLETRQFPPGVVKAAEQLLQERRSKQTKKQLPAGAKKLAGADLELPPPADLDDLDLLLGGD